MIDRFHSRDDLHQLWIVLVNVLDQFGLRVCRSGNENRSSVCNRFHDGVKVVVILCGISASDGIGFMMKVSCRMIRMQNESFHVRRAEMENAGFAMINPDDGMIVMDAHEISLFLTTDRREQPRYTDRPH